MAVPAILVIKQVMSERQLLGPGILRGWRRLCLGPCRGAQRYDQLPGSHGSDVKKLWTAARARQSERMERALSRPRRGALVIDVIHMSTPAPYDTDIVLSRLSFGQGSHPWAPGRLCVNRPMT